MNKEDKIRSEKQQRSMELYFKLLAAKLEKAGLDIQTVLARAVSRPWNQLAVKELLWKEIQRATTGKKSTTKLDTREVNEIYDILNRHLTEKFGPDLHIPFPSEDELYYNNQANRTNNVADHT